LGGITGAADLIPTNLSVSPTTVTPGTSVTVNVSITNQGLGTARAASHEIRLSNDAVVDANDQLVGLFNTGDLPPGGSFFVTATVGIPAGFPSGTRFIGVVADSGNAVPESNEANNIAIAAINVSGGGVGADLVPLNMSVFPAAIPAGGQATVQVTILNQGSATAPSTTHEIRLSPDSFIDRFDTFLGSFITGDVPPGASLTFAVGITIPSGTPTGGRFMGVIADAPNVVIETNEANNITSVFITIQ
jgi:subtilase family serine protease